MNSNIIIQGLRFVGLVLIQVLVLRRLMLEWQNFTWFNIYIYPLFLILLPFSTPRWAQLLLGFFLGLCIDMFSDSPGIHASACVFLAYIRPYILFSIKPRAGYSTSFKPTMRSQGVGWFVQYASILLILFLLWYHSVEAFSFVYIGDILLRTFFGYIFSLAAIMLLMYIFNPKE